MGSRKKKEKEKKSLIVGRRVSMGLMDRGRVKKNKSTGTRDKKGKQMTNRGKLEDMEMLRRRGRRANTAGRKGRCEF